MSESLPPDAVEFFRRHGKHGGEKLKRQKGKKYYSKIGSAPPRPGSRPRGRPPKHK